MLVFVSAGYGQIFGWIGYRGRYGGEYLVWVKIIVFDLVGRKARQSGFDWEEGMARHFCVWLKRWQW